MGKREVGQLGIIDLIVSILIAELVTISIEDVSKSILSSVVPILSLVILEMLFSYLSIKNNGIRNMIDGEVTFVIKNGRVNYREMLKQKYSLDDLLSQLREKGYRSIEEIEYAILENNGKLSVFPYSNDGKKSPIPLPLILDGKIQDKTLKELGKDKSFIDKILRNKIKIEDIFYAFYMDKKTYIIKK